MSDVLKMLTEWGCDIPAALQRCGGDTEFYLHWVSEFVRDPDFEKLNLAIRSKNYEAAFEAAHAQGGQEVDAVERLVSHLSMRRSVRSSKI